MSSDPRNAPGDGQYLTIKLRAQITIHL